MNPNNPPQKPTPAEMERLARAIAARYEEEI